MFLGGQDKKGGRALTFVLAPRHLFRAWEEGERAVLFRVEIRKQNSTQLLEFFSHSYICVKSPISTGFIIANKQCANKP